MLPESGCSAPRNPAEEGESRFSIMNRSLKIPNFAENSMSKRSEADIDDFTKGTTKAAKLDVNSVKSVIESSALSHLKTTSNKGRGSKTSSIAEWDAIEAYKKYLDDLEAYQ